MKAILVGLGGRSRHWQAACEAHPEVELVAYVEPSEKNKKRAIEERGVPANLIFDDLGDAASIEADFVVDVTPPAVHELNSMKSTDQIPCSTNLSAPFVKIANPNATPKTI